MLLATPTDWIFFDKSAQIRSTNLANGRPKRVFMPICTTQHVLFASWCRMLFACVRHSPPTGPVGKLQAVRHCHDELKDLVSHFQLGFHSACAVSAAHARNFEVDLMGLDGGRCTHSTYSSYL